MQSIDSNESNGSNWSCLSRMLLSPVSQVYGGDKNAKSRLENGKNGVSNLPGGCWRRVNSQNACTHRDGANASVLSTIRLLVREI